jgi:hypothetical protein
LRPFVTLVTTIVVAVPVFDFAAPPSLEEHDAVYPVMGEPPFAGGENFTVMRASPGVTVGFAGADGGFVSVVAADSGDAGPSPFALVANTVHVYVLPFVSPVTMMGDAAPDNVPGMPPLVEMHCAV